MAAPSSKCPFESFFNFYKDLISLCEENRRLSEAVCADYRKLFKPWPKVENLIEERNKVASAEAASTCIIQQESCGESELPSVEDVSVPSEVERTQLAILDDILSKATTIRNSQVKVKKKDIATHEQDPGPKKNAEVLNNHHLKNNTRNCNLQTVKLSQTKNSISSKSDTKRPGLPYTKNIGIVKQSVLNKIKQERTSLKYKPAHENAPFKTQNTAKPVRPKSGSLGPKISDRNVRLNQSKAHSAPSSIRLKQTNPISSTVKSHNCPQTEGRNHELGKVQQSKECDISGNISQQQMPHDITVIPDITVVPDVTVVPALKTVGVPTDTETNDTSDSHVHTECSSQDDKVFLLHKDGKNIPMSAPLRRQMMKNYNLRSKVMVYLSKPEEKRGRDTFLRKLEVSLNQADSNEPCSISEDILRLMQHYTSLELILDRLCLQDTTFTEDSDSKSIFRCKRFLEYILKIFDDLEAKYIKLCKAADNVTPETHIIEEILKKVDTIESNHHYIPHDEQGHVGKRPKDVLITYSRQKDIMKYYDFKHSQMILNTKLDILHLTRVLKMASIQDSHMPHELYRCFKSMVESIGEQFSVFVADHSDG